MTALSLRPARLALPCAARALRLELKRDAVPLLLPLLAAVFYFDTLRRADALPPVWTLRASVIGDHMLFEFSAFAGGLAAWAGSREGRRKTLDLVATTPRAAWVRLSVTLAGTLCWLLLAFLAAVGIVYVKTALQAPWGGPPLWPVLVGAAGVTVVAVIGFTAGVLLPEWFTAPLIAIGTLFLYETGFHAELGMSPASGTYAVLSPAGQLPMLDAGVYYRVPPDVPIVRVMLMGGIALALFGVLGLAAGIRHLIRAGGLRVALRALAGRGDGVRLRMTAAVLIGCGIAASGTAIALAGTAQPDAAGGWMIPALHSAASDRPVPVGWDCASAAAGAGARPAFQVCVSQAFSFYLHPVASAVTPVAAEIAGLPGAPAGAREIASVAGGQAVMSGITGTPPVFDFTAEYVGTVFGEFYGLGIGETAHAWGQVFQQGMLDAFLAGSPPHAGGPANVIPQFLKEPTPLGAAQQAVENALLAPLGWQPAIAGQAAGQWRGPALA
ncbi:MAG: hypothetical protein ACRDRJ_09845, partial [Streptosporangiaceae bacterium]